MLHNWTAVGPSIRRPKPPGIGQGAQDSSGRVWACCTNGMDTGRARGEGAEHRAQREDIPVWFEMSSYSPQKPLGSVARMWLPPSVAVLVATPTASVNWMPRKREKSPWQVARGLFLSISSLPVAGCPALTYPV